MEQHPDQHQTPYQTVRQKRRPLLVLRQEKDEDDKQINCYPDGNDNGIFAEPPPK
jgi:hypothetical protein